MRLYLRHLVAALATIADEGIRRPAVVAVASHLNDAGTNETDGLSPRGFDPELFVASVEKAVITAHPIGEVAAMADRITNDLVDAYRFADDDARTSQLTSALERVKALIPRLEGLLQTPVVHDGPDAAEFGEKTIFAIPPANQPFGHS